MSAFQPLAGGGESFFNMTIPEQRAAIKAVCSHPLPSAAEYQAFLPYWGASATTEPEIELDSSVFNMVCVGCVMLQAVIACWPGMHCIRLIGR